MQKLKEREMICVGQKDWVMRISSDSYPEFLNQSISSECTRRTGQILRSLGVEPKLKGYRCLMYAINLVAVDPWLLMKEIYPDVVSR